ncbi:uncharacterized protein LAESUDRAFT_760824 [Laetiporus sulphureus 93-53]|uniref:DRBM domain-containing protein n=1 Tax=Laetiporus sulphureus 93-53 TaxID=1314785 RepID=A0A165DFY7_9APHY|nr:uncharacterized protein LAESUDRAFT_760824 [Laetiporus sulphureus 93-53]KZT04807.1 hypothetical protein LAESUDRAFT_760824 [Laetiporus sulphureus 93-53]
MDAPPPVPKLRGDIILEVFTHKSLRFPGAPTNEESDCGDNERLSMLGEKVMDTAVTFTLFNKKPLINAQEIESQRMEVLSETNLNKWVSYYKLREKVRCSPDALASLTSPIETRLLFCSYVGAVYVQNGVETVQNWIGHLIDPEYESPVPAAGGEPYTYKRVKTEPMSSPTLPPSTAPLPPLPIDPLAPAKRQSTFLPLFNQTANQRRLAVEYPAQFSGLAHAGRWTVQCVVNGIPKGEGSGASKQLAKEEAARQAYYAMGWAPLECPPNPAPDVHDTGSGSTTGSGSGNGGGSSVGRTSESSAGSGTGSSSARAGAPSSSSSSSSTEGSAPLLRVGVGQAAGSGADAGSGSGEDAPVSVNVDGLGAMATAGNVASVEIAAPTLSSTSSGSAANAPRVAVDAGADSSAGSSASTNSGGSSGSGSGGDANAALTPVGADASGATATVGDLASVDLTAPTAPAAPPSSSPSGNDANSPLAVVSASTSGASPSSDGVPSPSTTGSDSGANAALISGITATAGNLAAFIAPAASPSSGCGSSNDANATLAVGNSGSFSFMPSFGSGAGTDSPISIGADDSGLTAIGGNLAAFTAPAASPASGSGSSNNANAPLADVNAGSSSSIPLSGSSDSGANAALISVSADNSAVAATAGGLPTFTPAPADTSSSSTTSSDSSDPLIVANIVPERGSSSNSGSSSGSGSDSDALIPVGADPGGVIAVVDSLASIAL